jgi:hypothetical protein
VIRPAPGASASKTVGTHRTLVPRHGDLLADRGPGRRVAHAGRAEPSPTVAAHRFLNAVLIAAAKTSPLKLVDNLATWCDGDVTVAAWLTALTRRQARSITT